MNYIDIKNILSNITDPVEKLEFVMDFGKNLSVVPDSSECTEISGCTSLVKICRNSDKFYAQADSNLVRGIVAIILAMIDGKSLEQIKKMDLHKEFFDLNLNLGAARVNGVNSILGFLQNI